MNKQLILLLSIFIFGCESWDPIYNGVILKNDSDHDVSFYLHLEKLSLHEYNILTGTPTALDSNMFRRVGKGNTEIFSYSVNDNENFKTDTLSIFVFSPDTLTKYSYDMAKLTNNYLKKFRIVNNDTPVTYQ